MKPEKSFSNLPPFFKVEELADFLGISRSTAFSLVKKPGFPSVRIGDKRIIIPTDLLIEWITSQAEVTLN